MRLIIGNVISQAVIGGKDNLLPFNLYEELHEYLKVKKKNTFFSQRAAVEKGQHYKVNEFRYFITKDGKFATGFLPLIAKVLTELGVNVDVDDRRGEIPVLKSVINRQVGNQELRDRQLTAILKLNNNFKIDMTDIYFPRGIIDAATNFGKTTVIAGVQLNLVDNPKAIFITHSDMIYKDALPRLRELFDVGEIKSGKYDPKNFTIAMAKTLSNFLDKSNNVKKDLQQYKVMYVDETHRAGAGEFADVVKQTGAAMRICVSGTPLDNEDNVKNMIIIGLSGPVLFKATNKELIEDGVSQRPIVHFWLNPTAVKSRAVWTYDEERTNLITENKDRTDLVIKIALEGVIDQQVISFSNIEHGKIMKAAIDNSTFTDFVNLPTDFIYGESTKIERENVMNKFKTGKTKLLFTSMVLREGVNLPSIRRLIRAEGGKSKITTKQLTGRAVRHDKIHDTVEIHDIFDRGRHTIKHSRLRMKQYEAEGYEIIRHYNPKEEKIVM